jgi:hypothetical protein
LKSVSGLYGGGVLLLRGEKSGGGGLYGGGVLLLRGNIFEPLFFPIGGLPLFLPFNPVGQLFFKPFVLLLRGEKSGATKICELGLKRTIECVMSKPSMEPVMPLYFTSEP